jgi:hypothetical protein
MSNALIESHRWAVSEFGQADLGDKRRTRRLVAIADDLATRPRGTMPDALKELKDVKASYDFFSHPEITYAAVTAAHTSNTRQATFQPGEYFLVQDFTSLDFTGHWATTGLGFIGDGGGRGMYLSSTLALKVHGWGEDGPNVGLLGLWDQEVWLRTETGRRRRETKAQRLQRERESQHWAKAIAASDGPPAGARWTLIADREADIFEVFQICQERQVGFIVRAARPRALAGGAGKLFEAVDHAPVLGEYQVALRARPGQPARTATLNVQAATVSLRGPWRPGGCLDALTLNVVQAIETNPPAGSDPLHWVLLTSWDCGTYADAMKVIDAYTTRWLVEEYHKALKTGTKVEDSQLKTAKRLQALLGVLAIVAVRLLRLKLLVAVNPDEPLQPDEETQAILTILEWQGRRPREGWTNRTLLITIAKQGGFLGRKRDGDPGWITIWRGVKELALMLQGYYAATGPK